VLPFIRPNWPTTTLKDKRLIACDCFAFVAGRNKVGKGVRFIYPRRTNEPDPFSLIVFVFGSQNAAARLRQIFPDADIHEFVGTSINELLTIGWKLV
jgi:hypothetical protein